MHTRCILEPPQQLSLHFSAHAVWQPSPANYLRVLPPRSRTWDVGLFNRSEARRCITAAASAASVGAAGNRISASGIITSCRSEPVNHVHPQSISTEAVIRFSCAHSASSDLDGPMVYVVSGCERAAGDGQSGQRAGEQAHKVSAADTPHKARVES